MKLSVTFAAATIVAFLCIVPVIHADQVAAIIDGDTISMSEVEDLVRAKLIDIENQRYEALQRGLDGIVAQRLIDKEAKARGITTDELEKAEISSKIAEPTDEEIAAVYEASKSQLGGAPLEEVRPRVVAYLKNQSTGVRAQAYLTELRAKYPVVVKLSPPIVKVEVGHLPSRGGGDDAPVVIVAFSDYQCPFCKRGEVEVAKVLEHYGDKVRYYHRDFPLPFHEHAHKAAEAADCANKQGKFWPFHDKLFKASELSPQAYQAIADELGLDRTAFDACMSSGEVNTDIEADAAAGTAAGVSGTPAFFINGRVLSGAQPFEKFQQLIDEEISRKQSGSTAQPAAE